MSEYDKLIEKLRTLAMLHAGDGGLIMAGILEDAKAAIESLQAENAKLQADKNAYQKDALALLEINKVLQADLAAMNEEVIHGQRIAKLQDNPYVTCVRLVEDVSYDQLGTLKNHATNRERLLRKNNER